MQYHVGKNLVKCLVEFKFHKQCLPGARHKTKLIGEKLIIVIHSNIVYQSERSSNMPNTTVYHRKQKSTKTTTNVWLTS